MKNEKQFESLRRNDLAQRLKDVLWCGYAASNHGVQDLILETGKLVRRICEI